MGKLCDARGRPYFSWDSDLTLDRWRALVADPDPDVRAFYIGRLMRQARPDDVFLFVDAPAIVAVWDVVAAHLGKQRPFWTWLLQSWGALGDGTEGPDKDAA